MKLTPIALSFEMTESVGEGVNGRIQLTPYGRFFAKDGRAENGGWIVDDSNGYLLASEMNSRTVEPMVDYEHKTLRAKELGEPNPAAGWIKRVEYLPQQGIFADVQWTETAREQVKNKEYRYISPLFLADGEGKVVHIVNAALTNTPANHDIAEAFALSAEFQSFKTGDDNAMLKLLQGLFDAPNASEAEIKEKLTALSAAKANSTVALNAVYEELGKQAVDLVALSAKANNPDPAKYVALSELTQVQTELNGLKAQINDEKRDSLIQAALSDGRLLPAQKAWAENLGKTNLTALSEFLSTVSPNQALSGGQSGGEAPTDKQAVALSAAELAGAKALGLSAAEYAAKYKTETK